MSAIKILAVILIVAGVIGLVYGGLTYTRTTHSAQVGPLHVAVKDRETVHIPLWAGVGAVVVGGLLLLARDRT